MNASAELIAAWRAEERAPFSGWDFSHLAGRMIEEQPPWSYIARARELLRGAKAALDIGTGGGERLLEMRPDWPRLMVAVEEYPPNVLISARRLAAEGGHVVAAPANEVEPLPFVDEAFDCVLNRHSAIHVPEIARVLTPGGVFFTQQVHGLWAEDLLAEFGARPQWPDATPQRYVPALEAAGLAGPGVHAVSGQVRSLNSRDAALTLRVACDGAGTAAGIETALRNLAADPACTPYLREASVQGHDDHTVELTVRVENFADRVAALLATPKPQD